MSPRTALCRLGRYISTVGQLHIRRAAVTALSTALLVAVLGAAPLPSGAQGTGLAAGTAAGSAGAAAETDDRIAPTDVLPAGGRWTVTLLTGEVVDVRADDEGRVTARVRDSRAPITTLRLPTGELYVIPKAALPLLDRVLDRALFDVTGLIRQHYDDASSEIVPLIVEREPGTDARAALGLSRSAASARPLTSIGAAAVEVPKARTRTTGAHIERRTAAVADAADDPGARAALDDVLQGVEKVWLDRRITARSATNATRATAAGTARQVPPLDGNLTQIGADDAWAAGLTGDGVRVGVLDTGIDADHPDLAGQVVAQANFSDSEDTVDRVGHGTHVAATLAGTGAAAGGARRGVAPDADLYVGKVLGDFGFGTEADLIAGMEWAAPQTDVVNVSIGGLIPVAESLVEAAVDNLTATHGTLFVIAAGNSGPASTTIESPGSADSALTVGAVDGADVLAEFSSRGPVGGSYELKPEVLAPGVDVVAARAAGTAMGEPVDDAYTAASGTSMATPHAAGAAALLVEQHPDWAPDDVKETLIGVAAPVEGDGYDVGGGRLAVDRAIATAVHAERDVVEATLAAPRTGPHTETLTWTNTGTAPASLALEATLEDRRGDAVDAAAVEPATLVLAPGATGSATLTVDAPALDDGLYAGAVTATLDGGATIRTPVAVHAGAETVDVTIEATGPGGPVGPGAVPEALFGIVDLDDFANFHFFGVMGGPFGGEPRWTLPVPKGRYAVLGQVHSGDTDTDVVAQAGVPEITIDEDTTVVLDGAAAVPLAPTVTGVDTAPPVASSAFMAALSEVGEGGFGIESYSWYPMPPVHVTPMAGDPDRFTAQQIYRLQAAHLTARVGDEAVDVVETHAPTPLPAGEQALVAVDAGDGADLSGAAGGLAVVRLPDDPDERAAVSQRAADAGVAVLAFVDEDRDVLTLDGIGSTGWSDVPTIAAAGPAATRLRAAGATGEQVTLSFTGSPYVYDIVGPFGAEVDPEPVIGRREQRRLARLDERFHRNPDGNGVSSDRRYPISVTLMNLDSAGPLPERRTAYVTPGVDWASIAFGDARQAWAGGDLVSIALSMDNGRSYAPGSRTTLRWGRPPLRPGPVGIPLGVSFCQPLPVARTADTLTVWLSPFQDGPDSYGCTSPDTAKMTLERDGVVVGTSDSEAGEFPVPAEAGTYRVLYDQEAEAAPYPHRSSTTWTFRSAAPGEGETETLIPLLVVDYELPLDTLNRPTGRTAELRVHQVTGTPDQAVPQLRVWTSTDDGATWRRATVTATGDGTWDLPLPRVAAGTGVSLKVDATDAAANRIEQILFDAYTG